MDRIGKLTDFFVALGKLREVERCIYFQNGRKETTAEHTWHAAMFVLLFSRELDGLDNERLLRMVLIHDIVEIEVGDVNFFDDEARKDKKEIEMRAAKKLFDQLPDDVGKEFLNLFVEFEEQRTKEARVALAIDRLQPYIHNVTHEGSGWKKHGIDAARVHEKQAVSMQADATIQQIYERFLPEVRRILEES